MKPYNPLFKFIFKTPKCVRRAALPLICLGQKSGQDGEVNYSSTQYVHFTSSIFHRKGNTRIRYEFGQKAAVVKTNSGNWIVNVEDLPNNPYDGHTLAKSISGAEKMTKVAVTEANVDKGYRGHEWLGANKGRLLTAGQQRTLPPLPLEGLFRHGLG